MPRGYLRVLSRRRIPHAILEKNPSAGGKAKPASLVTVRVQTTPKPLDATELSTRPSSPHRGQMRSALRCHLNTPTHIGRVQGGHAKGQVSCVGCHTVHQPDGAAGWSAGYSQSTHNAPHAIPMFGIRSSGRTRTSSTAAPCPAWIAITPTGASFPKNIQTALANEPGCFKCHGDKRGPFVFEHAPVRLDGCGSCHEPHGSTNPRMLVRHEVTESLPRMPFGYFQRFRAQLSGAAGRHSAGFPRPAERPFPQLHDLPREDPWIARQPGFPSMKRLSLILFVALPLWPSRGPERGPKEAAKDPEGGPAAEARNRGSERGRRARKGLLRRRNAEAESPSPVTEKSSPAHSMSGIVGYPIFPATGILIAPSSTSRGRSRSRHGFPGSGPPAEAF